MAGDITEIQTVLDRMSDAWARADGAGYGACFTHDATYISFVGTLYRGRDDIAAAHQVLLGSLLKGTRLSAEILEVRHYGDATAVLITRGDTYKGSKPGSPTKLQTYTLVRSEQGGWLVAAFQNTQRKKLMEAISFRLQPGSRPLAHR